MNDTTANTVAGFLASTAAMMKRCNGPSVAGYCGVPDFLSQHGRTWPVRPLPADIRQGKARACFQNCMKVATDFGAYTYCEGYAAGIIPVIHGWLVDSEGFAIDPTWTGQRGRPAIGFEYFGVAIKTEYLIEHLLRCEVYRPVTDDWSNDYPIFRDPLRKWKHPLNTQALLGR